MALVYPKQYLFLVGDGNVGKSSLIRTLKVGKCLEDHHETQGIEIHDLKLNTNYGKIDFEIWDTAGQEKFGKIRQNFYDKANMIIIMGDLNSRITFNNISSWYSEIIKRCQKNTKVVIVGNKLDLEKKANPNIIKTFLKRKNLSYFEISVKDQLNIDKPINYLLQQSLNIDDIQLFTKEDMKMSKNHRKRKMSDDSS